MRTERFQVVQLPGMLLDSTRVVISPRLLQNTDWKYKVPHAHINTANSRGYGVAATEPFPKKVNVPCFHIFKDEKITSPFTILL